jgi:hypothetical protein
MLKCNFSQKMIKAGTLISILILILLFSVNIGAENGCGDTNEDGRINVADAVRMVWCLKNYFPGLTIETSDLNNDGTVNIADAVVLINYIFRNGLRPACFPDVFGVSTGPCHDIDKSLSEKTIYYECFTWSYDGEEVLSVYHTEAEYNCGIDHIDVEVVKTDSTIDIIEIENFGDWGPAACLCFYNIEYYLTVSDAGNYHIRVYENEITEDSQSIDFYIELTDEPSSGEFCHEFSW